MLDLRRLRLLSELSRRGTIAEVASVVGYSPSAISQSLSQLERETGVALLERDGRRVRLTPAAHGLVAATDRVLAELDAAEAELAAEQEAVGGEIVIGAFPSAPAGGLEPPGLLPEPLLLVTAGDDASRLAAHRDAAWIAGLAGTQFA